MKRLLFQVHRWVGVALALFMLLWFVSGLLIIYAPLTTQSHQQQLAHAESLAPSADWLSLGEAWANSAASRRALASNAETSGKGADNVVEARLVRHAGQPLWLVEDGRGQRFALSASDGMLHETSAAEALLIAGDWLAQPAAALAYRETVERDSALRNLDAWRPFHRIAVADDAGRELIVSARTGEVLRVSTRVERGLYWAGNWLHMFRPLDALGWGDARRDILTWTAGAAALAILAGLIIGWLRWRPGWGGKRTYAEGRTQPYRAFWFRWHFWSGLLGGSLALLWALSGFLNNNPWQLFSPANPSRAEAARYLGGDVPPAMRDWRPAPLAAASTEAASAVVELGWRRLGKEAVLLGYTRGGERLPQSRFSEGALRAAAQRLVGGSALADVVLQGEYDSYYYPSHRRGTAEKPLPVLRVDVADGAGTRVYIDPEDGRLLARQDTSRRAFRWLFSAVHHWDVGWLYQRPLWDAWMLTWVLCGLVLSASSVVIGWQRLRRTFRFRRHGSDRASAPAELSTENRAA